MRTLVRQVTSAPRSIPYTNTGSTAISSGDPVQVGNLLGVAMADIHPQKTGTLLLDGIFTLPRESAETWTYGTVVGFDASAQQFTDDATEDDSIEWCGVAMEAVASGNATSSIMINTSGSKVVD